jgi:hypothetical protein
MVGESNDITGTAIDNVHICDTDTAFHVREAFYSLWTLKGTVPDKGFFHESKVSCIFEIGRGKFDRCGN